MSIKGNTVGTNTPRTNYEQTDPKKADYLKGKDKLDEAIAAAKSAAESAAAAAGNAHTAANNHASSTSNPHSVTASQVGARPDTWMPTASEVGARSKDWMPTASDVGAAPASHTSSTSNPHSVTASQVGARPNTWMPTASDVGAAPGGCGYGDELTYLNITDGTFEAKLDELLQGMAGYTARQIQLYDTVGLYENKFIGNLWKYTPNYVTLEAICYSGLKAIKRKVGGAWHPWEWVNAPMNAGVEYRTTKRFDGKVVYTMLVDLKTLPSNGTETTSANAFATYCEEGSTSVVSLSAILTRINSKGFNSYSAPFFNSSGVMVARSYANQEKVFVDVWTDLSNYTAKAIIEYTKD